MASLADGTPPIIGRVERFWKTTVEVEGEEVKALAFAFSFARDDDNELTPLAAAYKKLMPKYLDSFSVGMMVDEWEPREESNGFDINKSSLYEISVVAIPANAEANVVKAIKKVFEEQEIEVPEVKKDSEEPENDEKDTENTTKEQENVEETPKTEEDSNTSTHNNEEIKEFVKGLTDSLHKRLDSIESEIAILSKAKDEQTNGPNERPAEELESIKRIKEALNKLTGPK